VKVQTQLTYRFEDKDEFFVALHPRGIVSFICDGLTLRFDRKNPKHVAAVKELYAGMVEVDVVNEAMETEEQL
jgi:hypothetical protein